MPGEHTEKNSLRRLGGWLAQWLERRPILFTAALAFAVTLAVEAAGRHSLWQGLGFLAGHPVHFAVNWAIVAATLSIGLFFRRRAFALTLCAAVWLGLGTANAILLGFRTTPLGVVDIALVPSVFTVISVYLEVWQIVLLAAGVLLALAALVLIFRRSPRYPPMYRAASVFLAASLLAAGGLYGVTLTGDRKERPESLGNIKESCNWYGFVYCFTTELFERGISQPDQYSQSSVRRVMNRLEEASAPEERPNIIMVQLESFFDVNRLDDVQCPENPIPVFTGLRERYSSGLLTVPALGAGTANTEFEVLSGMSLDYFGMGEYPYMTVLKEEACETVATNLKALGYAAHAVHNNAGTFYDRNTVFAQLGFDTFTSIEYMRNVEYNPIGWAKDAVLTEEILKALDATPGQDFVFTITVQGHGKYQRGIDSEEAESLNITWAGEEDEEDGEAFAYYVSQLEETDAFIGQLLEAISRRGEPTVVVLYGDHLPNFDIGTDQLENGDVFQTEYVIWDNMGLPVEDKDLDAYQLSAQVLGRLGIGSGILTRYHQQLSGRRDYADGLGLLEYDMLYGEFYCFGGENPYTASDLQMGVEPITISGARWEDGTLTVSGRNFTAWSRITVDGDELDTVLADSGELTAELRQPPEDGAVITVRQDTATFTTLSESEGLRWKNR